MFGHALLLRGTAGLLIDLAGLKEEDRKERTHVITSLKVKVKEKIMETNHQFPCVKRTFSGLNVDLRTKLLIAGHKDGGRTGGLSITDWEENMLNTGKIDQRQHGHLIGEHEKGNEFPPEIKSVEDVIERYSVFRSLRRGSDTRAINMKVSVNDIDVVNGRKRK